MILVDSNVLMYAAGSAHPNKSPSAALVDKVAAGDIDAALDAEVLQEVLHRYRALNRWAVGREIYAEARRVFTTVLPITAAVMDRAVTLIDTHGHPSARDAVHAAVVLEYGLEGICTFDRDFDHLPGIRRVAP